MNRTLALVAVVCVLVSVATAAGSVTAGHDHEYTDFDTTPKDRSPGAESVDYRISVTVTDEFEGHDRIENPDQILFAVNDTNLEPCSEDGRPFADLPHSLYVEGPDGDRSTLSVGAVVWDDEAALVGLSDEDQPAIAVGDTLVFELDGCVTNPANPNWYQGLVNAEGEGPDGETANITAFSHYFGICEDCASDQDAREELGPPPSAPDPTPTATPTATATATPTATETPTPTATETPTATAPPTATATRVATATPSPMSTATTAGTESATGTAGGDTGEPPAEPTPSVGDAPGLGPPAGLVSLALASALYRRRL